MKRAIQLMGIVNLTDDSFYAPSRVRSTEALLRRVATLLQEGADSVDLGACSTRPGALPVGEKEEWRRLRPALKALREAFPALNLSIDTYWSGVARRAYDTIGPFTVNDISAGAQDPAMLRTVGALGLPYIAMHMRGTPETMQTLTDYPDGITAAVLRYFRDFAARAADAGIQDWIADPGFGFSKTLEQNWTLLRELGALQALGRPILVGVSRKSMIYKRFGLTPETSLEATQIAHRIALEQGATILRVHDIAPALATVRQWQAEEISK